MSCKAVVYCGIFYLMKSACPGREAADKIRPFVKCAGIYGASAGDNAKWKGNWTKAVETQDGREPWY